ncbi:N-acetylmuramoyl-L-alanine amidase [Alkaliphilus hydrothermalis]|uniref:N-acetylmuramoyl-L-alanine amidase n=1 Tax=Alkaliphilus hydrothermalis TaxID=1482730 RepID=A0ABS2NMH1_9FIRM|nr:N-acetylmuramoyl-L-alanine amidase [Alkaliphilus hydrothermalis]MBM7614125.1 N-acetylmuramoyl-L-alanine amidase [Alkaliphilus hydrothermalis]
MKIKRPTLILLLSRKARTYISSLLISVFVLVSSPTILDLVIDKPVEPLFDKTIVVDPGHGGIDGGTSFGNDMLEKNINLEISMKLKEALLEQGAKVVMTREIDNSLDDQIKNNGSRHREDLQARAKIIDNNPTDLFLSIHVNCMRNKPDKIGPIVFYYGASEDSKALAEEIQKKLNQLSTYKELGIKATNKVNRGNYYILKYTSPPGVIIETGFISNSVDRRLLLEGGHQDELVRLIVEGVMEYLGR